MRKYRLIWGKKKNPLKNFLFRIWIETPHIRMEYGGKKFF